MARTKASVGAKISSGKSSKARCSVVPATSTGISSGGSDKSRGSGGGNPVCPRETPKWQKPITNFFITKHNESQESVEDGDAAGSSKPKFKKRNIIESSDDDTTPEKPKNKKTDTEKPDIENPDIENPDIKKPDTETPDVEKPKNNVLDETIELQPLTGENSHKIQEYYPKGAKGKGKGKKTKETKDIESKGENEDDVIDVDENSDDSNKTDKETMKGKGKGKKTKEIKDVDSNGVKEKDDGKDKENIDTNIEMSDKDNTIVARKKREREDRIEEEGNISKKIKVN